MIKNSIKIPLSFFILALIFALIAAAGIRHLNSKKAPPYSGLLFLQGTAVEVVINRRGRQQEEQLLFRVSSSGRYILYADPLPSYENVRRAVLGREALNVGIDGTSLKEGEVHPEAIPLWEMKVGSDYIVRYGDILKSYHDGRSRQYAIIVSLGGLSFLMIISSLLFLTRKRHLPVEKRSP